MNIPNIFRAQEGLFGPYSKLKIDHKDAQMSLIPSKVVFSRDGTLPLHGIREAQKRASSEGDTCDALEPISKFLLIEALHCTLNLRETLSACVWR